jgi:hypothetical protein
MFNRDWLLA